MKGRLSAEMTEVEGRLGDSTFDVLLLRVEGVRDPHMLTLAFPRSSVVGLKGKVEAIDVYRAVVSAVNRAEIDVEITP